MTWNAFRHRGEILRTVVDFADERRDGVLPMDLPGVRENFDGELDLLSALLLKWHARLSGNVERELMLEPMDLEAAVARAWRRTSDEMPGVRAIVDRYTETPSDAEMGAALSRAHEREWLRLAGAAGKASDESLAAARVGRQIEDRARTMGPVPAAPADPDEPTEPVGLVERIRAVLAA